MTSVAIAAMSRCTAAGPAAVCDTYDETRELRAELERLEPLVGAAFMTATAFRLRDRDALSHALRLLVSATRAVEEAQACA